MFDSDDDDSNAIDELMRIAQVYIRRGEVSKAQEVTALAQQIMRRKARSEGNSQNDENCG